MTRWPRRRGTSYVFFLSTALLVTIIGLSALTVMRVKLRAVEDLDDGAAARLYAQSAIEYALLAIYTDPSWRDAIAHDTWEATQSIGRGSFTWKLIDETNDNLTTDRSAPLRVYGQGVCGESVWVYSVLVQPPLEGLPTNMLVNGDFESGTTAWTGWHCDIESSSVGPHGGSMCLWAKDRTQAHSGPYQIVTGSITSGTTYCVDVWVRLEDAPEDVAIKLWLETSNGDKEIEGTAPAGTGWTQVTVQITPTWDGELQYADLLVATAATEQDFYIDDVSMIQVPTTIGPIPGTWRREAQ